MLPNYPTTPHQAQPAQIRPGSPIAVLGIFLEVLRERFAEGQGLPWVWRPDTSTTDICIEVGYNAELAARTRGVGLYLNRLQTVPGVNTLGERADWAPHLSLETYTTIVTSSLSIDCVSPDMGESMQLADTVQYTLMCGKDLIAGFFGLHGLSHPIMSQSLPYEHDQPKFSTTISFDAQHQVLWQTRKIRPLLQQVVTRLVDSETGMDPAGALVDVVMASTERMGVLPPKIGTVAGTPISAPIPEVPPGGVLIPPDAVFLPNLRLEGALDSVNRAFVSQMPFLHTDIVHEIVYRNGVREDPSRYTVTSTRPDGLFNTVTFLTPPLPNDLLVLDAYLPKVG